MSVVWEEEHIDGVCLSLNFTTLLRTFSHFHTLLHRLSKLHVSPNSLTFRPHRPHRPHYAERQPPTRLDQRNGLPT
jgi:hypothetical protein